MYLTGGGPDGEALLEIHKLGRFTSHMDFAEFVVAAVEATAMVCAAAVS